MRIKGMKLFFLFALFTILAILFVFVIQNNSEDESKLEIYSVGTSGDAYSTFNPEKLDEVIGKADIIVLGKVTMIENIGNQTDEHKFEIEKQYKGRTLSKNINVYEHMGTLKENQTYLLFLTELTIPYYPDKTYRSIDKGTIVAVHDEKLKHSSQLISGDIDFKNLEKLIKASDQITVANAPIINYPVIEQKRLTIDELINKADLIAHVKVSDILSGNKYVKDMKLDFNHVYDYKLAGTHDLDYTKLPYIMPATMELGHEYLIFLKYIDNMFYTVSVDGSIISINDSILWNEAINKLK